VCVFEGKPLILSHSLTLSPRSLFPSLSLSLFARIIEGYVCSRFVCVCSKSARIENEEFSFPQILHFFPMTTTAIRAPMATTTTLSRKPLVVVAKRRNTKTTRVVVVVVAATTSSGGEEIDDEEKERAKKQNLTTTSTREYYEGFFKSPLGEQSVDGNNIDGERRRDSIAPTIKFALNSSLVVGALLVLFLASNGLL